MDVRLVFSKKDRAKFISHLDLYRSMQRAVKRAGIPIWYTEGFNPHAYIMFPLPLSLGTSSECETLDLRLTKELSFEEIKNKLNNALPEGIEILSVNLPKRKHKDIAFSIYKIILKSDNLNDLSSKFKMFLSQDSIEIEKKNKKKQIKLVDIKPMISLLNDIVIDDSYILEIKLPSGVTTNLNPSVILDEFKKYIGQDKLYNSIERTKILCYDDEIFS